MNIESKNIIPDLIKANIPKELILAIREGSLAANIMSERIVNNGLSDGHIGHALGQLRHFYGNEMFSKAIISCGFDSSAIKGNAVVTATCGMWTIARFNTIANDWAKGRRSKSRKELVKRNVYLEQFVQNDLFGHADLPQMGVVFFVCSHIQKASHINESDVDIHLVVTNSKMDLVLFDESLSKFLDRYMVQNNKVEDKVKPKLKGSVKRQTGNGEIK